LAAFIRLLVCVLTVAAVVAGGLQIDTEVLARQIERMQQVPFVFVQQRSLAGDLDSELAIRHRVTARKRAVTEDLLAGRTTLRQAAAEFNALDKELRFQWDRYADMHPEWSAEICCAHYVIDEVHYILRSEDKDSATKVAELEAELATW
jgi:hypothetical protein